MKKIFSGLFFVTFLMVMIFVLAPGVRADAGHLVISQVQITGGAGRTNDDFVELYNPTDRDIPLAGYQLVKRTETNAANSSVKTWSNSDAAVVQARGFYLWVNGDTADASLLAQADATTKISIASNNGVGLLDAADQLIDSLAWGTASNGFSVATTTNPGANMALVLVDVNNSAAGFAIAASHPRNSSSPAGFAPSEEHGEAPTSTPDSTASTTPESQATTTDDSALNASPSGGGSAVETVAKSFAVKITEILANPAGDDSGNEQVELINTGSQYVNLEGWMIGDSTATSSKNNVLVLHNILMPPGSVTAIIIPKGLFAFNNTGGDEARLYFADKTLADAAAYADTAPEGQSYQQINGSWLWGAPSLGMRNFAVAAPSPASSANPAAQAASPLSIAEIMPNPEGADEGREWVELYNNSDAEVSLQGYFLDDDGTGAPGGSAWQLGDVSAGAHQYIQLIIPEDAFTLVNTQNAVRLFSPARQLIERIAYAGVSEGKSYAKDDQGKWNVSFPTPGAENLVELPDYAVVISEVLPNPAGDDDEFIELQNVGGNDINVKDFIVSIGSRALKIADAATVTPFSFYTVYEDDLPVHLRNAGQTITVGDNFGRQLASLTYGKAPAGQSFALDSSGAYVWTSGLTPDEANQFILGAAVAEPAAAAATASAKKSSGSGATETSYAQLYRQAQDNNEILRQQLSALQDAVERLGGAAQVAAAAAPAATEEIAAPAANDDAAAKPRKIWYVVGVGISALLFGILAKRYF